MMESLTGKASSKKFEGGREHIENLFKEESGI